MHQKLHNNYIILRESFELIQEKFSVDFLTNIFYELSEDNKQTIIKKILKLKENILFKNIENRDKIIYSLFEEIDESYYIDKSKSIPYISGYSDSSNILYLDKDIDMYFS